jgi:Fe-Mn family superoxide dismutase
LHFPPWCVALADFSFRFLVPGAPPTSRPPPPTPNPQPYAYNALEPHIDEATMKVHHTGHHQTYTTNLNAALEKLKAAAPELAALPLAALLQRIDDAPEALRGPLRNSGGGFVNHLWFFTAWMAPPGAGVGPDPPAGALLEAIVGTWGSVAAFKEAFSNAAATVFGSGWAWLVVDRTGGAPVLRVEATPNQVCPNMTPGKTAILGLDVWEHA